LKSYQTFEAHVAYYHYDEATGNWYYPLYKDIEAAYDVQLNFDTYFPGLGIPDFAGVAGSIELRGDTWYFPRNTGLSLYTSGTTYYPGGFIPWTTTYADMPNAFGSDIPS
jgi:hypothetical protein